VKIFTAFLIKIVGLLEIVSVKADFGDDAEPIDNAGNHFEDVLNLVIS